MFTKQASEIRRYALTTADPAYAAHFVEIVTNDHDAMAYFQVLMASLGLRGHVRCEP